MAAALLVSACGTSMSMPWTTVYGSARDQRSIGEQVDDQKISARIKYDIINDSLTEGLDISVYTYLGQVFLIGEIVRPEQEARARTVDGVESVTAFLPLKADGGTEAYLADARITTEVKAKLIADRSISSTQIEVKTIQSQVVLLGLVARPEERDLAVQYAQAVQGVREVRSFIIVSAR
ncbi:MAG: BON domain-containing protein [Proteobacteria bacterium]|nr:BON domain-containing protein [Pseudomonadota bacterium]